MEQAESVRWKEWQRETAMDRSQPPTPHVPVLLGVGRVRSDVEPRKSQGKEFFE